MTSSPFTLLALARARQDAFLREAERDALRRAASSGTRPSLVARLASFLRRRPERRVPSPA